MNWSQITSLWLISPQHVIAGGYNGGLWYTRDGGDTWFPARYALPNNRHRDSVHIWGLAALGNRIFAIGWKGTLLVSDDGGVQWSFVDTGAKLEDDFCGIHADPRGFIVLLASAKSSGVLIRSIDGGATWTRTTHERRFDQVAAESVDEFYVVHDHAQVLESTDGGRSFSSIFKMPDWPSPYRATIAALRLIESGRLLVVGSAPLTTKTPGSRPGEYFIKEHGHKGLIFEVRQGNARPIETGIDARWEAAATPSLDEWLLVSTDGIVARTTDGGQTWQRHQLPPPTQKRHLQTLAATTNTVFVAGQSALYRSDGECVNWTDVHRRPVSIDHVFVASWGDVFGLGNRLLRRGDTSNLNWHTLPGIEFATAIVEVAPNTLLALDGGILRSSDRGNTWTRVVAQGKPHLRHLTALGNGKAIAVGQRGAIMESDDGGLSWAPCKHRSKKDLSAVWGQDTFIVTVGASGCILHSEDGGKHFEIASVPPRTPGIDEIAVTQDSVIVALAREHKLILRSTDYGRTWKKHEGLFPNWVHGLVTLTDGNLALCGDNGNVFLSADGLSWKRVHLPLGDTILSIACHSPERALLTTASGIVVDAIFPPR